MERFRSAASADTKPRRSTRGLNVRVESPLTSLCLTHGRGSPWTRSQIRVTCDHVTSRGLSDIFRIEIQYRTPVAVFDPLHLKNFGWNIVCLSIKPYEAFGFLIWTTLNVVRNTIASKGQSRRTNLTNSGEYPSIVEKSLYISISSNSVNLCFIYKNVRAHLASLWCLIIVKFRV